MNSEGADMRALRRARTDRANGSTWAAARSQTVADLMSARLRKRQSYPSAITVVCDGCCYCSVRSETSGRVRSGSAKELNTLDDSRWSGELATVLPFRRPMPMNDCR